MKPGFKIESMSEAKVRRWIHGLAAVLAILVLAFSVGCGQKKKGSAGAPPKGGDKDGNPPMSCPNCPQSASSLYKTTSEISVGGMAQLSVELFTGSTGGAGSQSIQTWHLGQATLRGQMVVTAPLSAELSGVQYYKECVVPAGTYQIQVAKAGNWIGEHSFQGVEAVATNGSKKYSMYFGYAPNGANAGNWVNDVAGKYKLYGYVAIVPQGTNLWSCGNFGFYWLDDGI